MNSARHRRAKKPTYFRKDYAPAVFLADQKRAKTFAGRLSKQLRTFAVSAQKSLKKSATSASKHFQKSIASLRRRAASSSHKVFIKIPTLPARKSKSTRTPLTWREVSLLSMIGISVITITFSFIFSHVYDPVRRSQQELEKIAYDYYIEYLYPYSLGRNISHPETILADYAVQGLPAVKLRQLLLYNNGKYASSASIFSNQYFSCDKNQTTIRYYPVEPYGPRDFTITYSPSCEKLGSVN